jgi:hypothetical protein|tara:strand:- start:868 stop:1086 length:219 start_codon:yes stop_codon:yes gene_type:complete
MIRAENKFKYRTEKRRYLSFADQCQDLTTDSLISLIPDRAFARQMDIMKEIEKRNELSDSVYFELLETCNGL